MTGGDLPFLGVAHAIGVRLCRDAVWDGDRCNWLGASTEPVGGRWTAVHRSFGPDLYAGTSGIACFLGRLYQATGDRIVRQTAEGAIRQALSRLEDVPPEQRVGLFTGHAGIAWALVEMGEACGEETYLDRGLQILESLGDLDFAAQPLDLMTGCAGAILALLAVHHRYPRTAFPEIARRLGERLLAAARPREHGWSWTTLGGEPWQRDDLTGFSHGTAGIACALLELHRAVGDGRFLTAAENAFAYERHWYDPERENWPDLRRSEAFGMAPAAAGDGEPPLVYAIHWCHGAPGSGLAHLRAWQLRGDEQYREAAGAALRTTWRDLTDPGGTSSFSLCHGRAGNAELLLQAARVLGDEGYKACADHVGRLGAETYEQHGFAWPGGTLGGGESPGLMLGSAGIGHFFIRLHDPAATPPVLILIPERG